MADRLIKLFQALTVHRPDCKAFRQASAELPRAVSASNAKRAVIRLDYQSESSAWPK